MPTATLPDLQSAWRAGFRDLTIETVTPVELEVAGQLPVGLEGVLYRNGPARFDIFGERYQHWFERRWHGPCAAHWSQQRNLPEPLRGQRGQSHRRRRPSAGCFAEFGTGPAGGAIGRWRNRGRGKNTGNTNIIQHGGRLLALMEGGRPHRLDPDTLETLGEEDFDGVLSPSAMFSAHPKLHRARATSELRR